MKKKLYVGNLSFEATETELKEFFDQAGSVETVRIITDRGTGRSKGFGFVEMQDGGDKAIAEMNGKDFKGRALTVIEARPMSPGIPKAAVSNGTKSTSFSFTRKPPLDPRFCCRSAHCSRATKSRSENPFSKWTFTRPSRLSSIMEAPNLSQTPDCATGPISLQS